MENLFEKIGKKLKATVKEIYLILKQSHKEFNHDKCYRLTSTLAVYSVMSIVPILAMIFALAKGFGFEKLLQEQLLNQIPQNEQFLSRLFTFSKELLQNTQGSLMAGVGVIILFWSASRLFWHLESIFDTIWHVKSTRSYSARFINYTFMIFLLPTLIIVSSSLMVFISSYIVRLKIHLPFLQNIGFFASLPIILVPYVVIWLIFLVLFLLLPNVKVSIKSVLFAAILSGTMFQLLQWVYLKFQFTLSFYNPIYGSFAAIPLFVIWLRLSWSILLFGAEFAATHQFFNIAYPTIPLLSLNFYQTKVLSLKVLSIIVKRFSRGEEFLSTQDISAKLGLQEVFVRDILANMVKAGLLTKTKGDVDGFVPAMGIDLITLGSAIDKLEKVGSSSKFPAHLATEIESFGQMIEKSKRKKLLKDIY